MAQTFSLVFWPPLMYQLTGSLSAATLQKGASLFPWWPAEGHVYTTSCHSWWAPPLPRGTLLPALQHQGAEAQLCSVRGVGWGVIPPSRLPLDSRFPDVIKAIHFCSDILKCVFFFNLMSCYSILFRGWLHQEADMGDLNSPTRDRSSAPCIRSMESQLLDSQESPS